MFKSLHLQGHALLTRHLGSSLPCPYTDYDAGWEQWFAAAYNLPKGQTIKQKFGASFGAVPHVILASGSGCRGSVAIAIAANR